MGTHRILVGGRSARFAIDSVGLELISGSGGSNQPDPVTTPVSTPSEPLTDACIATDANLSLAKSEYANNCPGIPRADCDPLPDGSYICSSENISGDASALLEPTEPEAPVETTEPSMPIADTICTASGSSLEQAKQNFVSSCPTFSRQDCDPVSGGGWMCSSGVIGASAPGVTATPSTSTTTPSAPTTTPSSPVDDSSSPGGGDTGFISANNLLALHHNNCPDTRGQQSGYLSLLHVPAYYEQHFRFTVNAD